MFVAYYWKLAKLIFSFFDQNAGVQRGTYDYVNENIHTGIQYEINISSYS